MSEAYKDSKIRPELLENKNDYLFLQQSAKEALGKLIVFYRRQAEKE